MDPLVSQDHRDQSAHKGHRALKDLKALRGDPRGIRDRPGPRGHRDRKDHPACRGHRDQWDFKVPLDPPDRPQ